jgi:hypothetical protein
MVSNFGIVKEFSSSSIKLPLSVDDPFELASVNYLVGGPGTGKTHLMAILIERYYAGGWFHYGVGVCPKVCRDDYKMLSDDELHFEYNDDIVTSLIAKQTDLIQKGTPNNAFLVLDNCLTSLKSDVLAQLISNCRHYNITVFITSQILLGLEECAANVFLFGVQHTKVKAIRDAYMSELSTREVRQFINKNTKEPHSIFLIKNHQRNDKYKRIKA